MINEREREKSSGLNNNNNKKNMENEYKVYKMEELCLEIMYLSLLSAPQYLREYVASNIQKIQKYPLFTYIVDRFILHYQIRDKAKDKGTNIHRGKGTNIHRDKDKDKDI